MKFLYPIKKELMIGELKIILLDIPLNERYNMNVFCLDNNGDFVWQIEGRAVYPGNQRLCPFVEIENRDGKLLLWNWCSFRYTVDPTTGKVLEVTETR